MSSTENDADAGRSPSALGLGFAVLAGLVVLYSVLILAQPLLGLSVVFWLVAVYLLWRFLELATRFVRAVERIADAMERRDGPR